jgi:hypothetical protein
VGLTLSPKLFSRNSGFNKFTLNQEERKERKSLMKTSYSMLCCVGSWSVLKHKLDSFSPSPKDRQKGTLNQTIKMDGR